MKQKSKLLLLGLVVLSIVMCTSAVSATSYYGSQWPQIPKGQGPYGVIVGGRTASAGAWASSYMSNLIPGTYYGVPCLTYSAISYYDASRPCNTGGSWFGGYSNYGRTNYGWGGAWGNYGNYNTYGGNVGWATRYPSYGYNYGGYA